MAFKTINLLLLLCVGGALSQYDATMYMRANNRNPPYESTRQEIVNNFLNNKPLLNYVPVYNTEYDHWHPHTSNIGKAELQKKQQINTQTFNQPIKSKIQSDVDFQKLGEIVTRLKTDMQTLSHQTKHAYDDKLKELGEVKKLNDDLKLALQNTDVLKTSLYEHEKQLNELTKNLQGRNDYPAINPEGVEQFLNMIESLELMVRNISNKYGGKLGM